MSMGGTVGGEGTIVIAAPAMTTITMTIASMVAIHLDLAFRSLPSLSTMMTTITFVGEEDTGITNGATAAIASGSVTAAIVSGDGNTGRLEGPTPRACANKWPRSSHA